jgi:hypothetical protein
LQEPLSHLEYSETHHILPKCLGGKDKNNLVKLTAKEHYIAHALLTKFIIGDGYYKVIKPFFCMSHLVSKYHKRHIPSRVFEYLRIENSKSCAEYMKKRWLNDQYREKMSADIKASWENGSRNHQLQYMKENSPFKNKEIHVKTMATRTERGANIWVTNNPMKNPERAKHIAAKRSGKKHWLSKDLFFEYSEDCGQSWISIDKTKTIDEICNQFNWSRGTFNKTLKTGKSTNKGPMKNILVRRVKNENN